MENNLLYQRFINLIQSKSYTFRQLFDFCDKYKPKFIKYVILNDNNWLVLSKPEDYNERYIAYKEMNTKAWHVVTHEYNPELIDNCLSKKNINYMLAKDSKNTYLVSIENIYDTDFIIKNGYADILYEIKMLV